MAPCLFGLLLDGGSYTSASVYFYEARAARRATFRRIWRSVLWFIAKTTVPERHDSPTIKYPSVRSCIISVCANIWSINGYTCSVSLSILPQVLELLEFSIYLHTPLPSVITAIHIFETIYLVQGGPLRSCRGHMNKLICMALM